MHITGVCPRPTTQTSSSHSSQLPGSRQGSDDGHRDTATSISQLAWPAWQPGQPGQGRRWHQGQGQGRGCWPEAEVTAGFLPHGTDLPWPGLACLACPPAMMPSSPPVRRGPGDLSTRAAPPLVGRGTRRCRCPSRPLDPTIQQTPVLPCHGLDEPNCDTSPTTNGPGSVGCALPISRDAYM